MLPKPLREEQPRRSLSKAGSRDDQSVDGGTDEDEDVS
jgi:hypothetical protein